MTRAVLGSGSSAPCSDAEQALIGAAFAPGTALNEPTTLNEPLPSGSNPYSGQYTLSGPAKVRDPRVTPIRGDLADIALAGKLFAPHYVVPMERAVAVPFAALMDSGRSDAGQTSELLQGERFMVLDIAGQHAWGYCAHDCYNGYLALDALGDSAQIPAPAPALAAAALAAADPVAVAQGLLGMVYLWGGRGGAGIDCSGLVQTSFARAGHKLARDSDQQAASAGRVLGEDEAPARGDLIFFRGHVGILLDPKTLIHASQGAGGIGGAVVIELLADVVARRLVQSKVEGDGGITLRRRVL